MANERRKFEKKLKAFDLPRSYVSYDLETTDKFENGGRVIEIGAVFVDKGELKETFETLVAIPDGTPIAPEAFEKHGLTREDLEGAPEVAEAYIRFCSFIGTLPLVGFNNKNFDDRFLEAIATDNALASIVQNSRDVQELFEQLHGGMYTSLKKVCETYDVVNEEAHRALSDAEATAKCYEHVLKELEASSTDARDINVAVTGDSLSGEVICFSNGKRTATRLCQELAKSNGAELGNDVTKKTTLVVNLSEDKYTSGKVKKAQNQGIRVVDKEEFYRLAGRELTDESDWRTGVWFSDMDPIELYAVKQHFELPVQKALIYISKDGFSEKLITNAFGVQVSVIEDDYKEHPVKDARVRSEEINGMSTLDVLCDDGYEVRLPVNTAYFAQMNKGFKSFVRDMSSAAEKENEDE